MRPIDRRAIARMFSLKDQVEPSPMDKCDELTVRDLRRLWKPHKARLAGQVTGDATNTRLHRAFSWLNYVERMDDPADDDLALVARWTAFNALYGQWNQQAGDPMPDRECWQVFAQRVMELDAEGRMVAILRQHQPLAVTIFEDRYLSRHYWQDPEAHRGDGRAARRRAQTYFAEQRWLYIVEQLLGRIYLIRCQIVHGAANHGSRLNRDSLRHCSVVLGHLLGGMIRVMIDHGADEDWGIMCYPPITHSRRNKSSHGS